MWLKMCQRKESFSLSHAFPSSKAGSSRLVCVGGMEERRDRGGVNLRAGVCFHSVYKDVLGQKRHRKGHKSQGPTCPWPYKHSSTKNTRWPCFLSPDPIIRAAIFRTRRKLLVWACHLARSPLMTGWWGNALMQQMRTFREAVYLFRWKREQDLSPKCALHTLFISLFVCDHQEREREWV